MYNFFNVILHRSSIESKRALKILHHWNLLPYQPLIVQKFQRLNLS